MHRVRSAGVFVVTLGFILGGLGLIGGCNEGSSSAPVSDKQVPLTPEQKKGFDANYVQGKSTTNAPAKKAR